ncbi:hypothetical protein LLG96_12315 [bacterium]|nr:hypothetical protein [bacterium]
MKNRVFSCILVYALTLSFGGTAFAVDPTIMYRNTKTIGMGDAKIAGGYGYNGFINNPALLARVPVLRFSIPNLPFTLNNDFWETAKFIKNNSDKFQDYGDLTESDKQEFLKDLEEYDGKWSRLRVQPLVDLSISFFDKTELAKITDSKETTYKDDMESVLKAIEANEVIFTTYYNDTISFGKVKDKPGMYYVSGLDPESLKEFDSYEKAYAYWTKKYRRQMNDGFGVGLAVFNNTMAGLKIDRGVFEPRVWGEGDSDTAVILGFAQSLNMVYPGLTVGVNLKYFDRRHANMFQIKATDLGNIQDTAQPIIDDAKNSSQKTYAADIGALCEVPYIGADVGMNLKSLGDGRGSSVDFGIAKHLYGESVLLLADYIDFLDNNRENIFRKLHFGAQYKADFVYLRAGINSGYPTAGLGLNARLVDIDVAWFSEELSNAPGVEPDTRYAAQIKFGW